MVEIKGFNEAYKAMLAKETVKKIHKKHTDNRVKIAVGTPTRERAVSQQVFSNFLM